MANEISVLATLAVANGYASLGRGGTTALTHDQSGNAVIVNLQNIGTVEEALLLGDITTKGWIWVKNLDATNFIELRPNTAVADMIKILPGEEMVFRLAPDAVPYAIANTAGCDLLYILCEA